jgi:OmpA-OmpF porin, OOP family
MNALCNAWLKGTSSISQNVANDMGNDDLPGGQNQCVAKNASPNSVSSHSQHYPLYMKRFITLTLFLLSFIPLLAQQKPFVKTPALGIHAAFFDFAGADSLKSFGKHSKPGLAIHFQNNISRKLEYTITTAGSFLEFFNKKNTSLSNGEKKLLLETDLSLRLKLTPPENRVHPYVQGGVGVSVYNNYVGLFIPAGLGLQVNVTRDLFVLVNTQYRIPVTNTQHRHFYHSIGLAGAITRKKISKPAIAIPSPPPQAISPIQVDTDGDGILDSADRCPAVPGMFRYQGCPPPDRDGDRIIDEEDVCPDVKGEAAYSGCPPPDKDQDGITDLQDKCPDVPGPVSNQGCPEIPDTLRAALDSAAQLVFFETGSHTLAKRSYPALQLVTRWLLQHPTLHLIIEGHTDNAGTIAGNRLLSERRAQAVMNYLTKAGIESTRMQAIGYGQQKPIAGNATTQGRAKNRRVAFVLKN